MGNRGDLTLFLVCVVLVLVALYQYRRARLAKTLWAETPCALNPRLIGCKVCYMNAMRAEVARG